MVKNDVHINFCHQTNGTEEINSESTDSSHLISSTLYFAYWKNQALQYIDCNYAYAQLLGFSSPVDLINKTNQDLKIRSPLAQLGDAEVLSGNEYLIEIKLNATQYKVVRYLFLKYPLI